MSSSLDTDYYLQRIQTKFREPIDSYRIINGGWTNLVIEINNCWIYRFVRNVNNRQIEVERDFLPKFNLVSPIDIPDLMCSAEDYIAYRKLEGERFAPEKFYRLSSTKRTSIIKYLAEFLTTLHNFEFSHSHLAAYPYGGKDFWLDLWRLVGDRLSEPIRSKAKRYFDNYFSHLNDKSIAKCLTHSDLGTNNILDLL